MASSLLPSAPTLDGRDELLRRFVEASLRARIVTIVNRADSERELGALITAELCEAFEAEIAFVLAQGEDGACDLVGTYGIQPGEVFDLFDDELCGDLFRATEPELHSGHELVGLDARHLVVVPCGSATGVIGVARLHDARFDEAEVALLQAIAESVRHALERIRLAAERDRLYREAEERGQAARVLGSVADGVFLVDAAGTIRLWNRAAETITRLPADEILGRPATDVIPAWATLADLIVVSSTPAESGGRATSVPVEINGREIWLSIAGVGFDDGTVYAFRDLTEERHLEQLKTDFIATVSHELRTPIAAVHGAAKTLERRDIVLTEESRSDLLAIISEQSERLVAIVNDILLASQVEDHRLTLTTERVDVAELARRAIAAARAHAPKRLTLEVLAPPAVPAVAADADKLAQVFANLVANAVKYSPEGGRIELRLEPRETDVCITVSDEGLGIPETELDRIFDKFYRVDPNMARGVSGSGLGLYICRELVRRMGGSIAVESEVGTGSKFFVVLPLASPARTS
ncbi:MAG: ATP-binding protein [Gaiellaceae bacterium]